MRRCSVHKDWFIYQERICEHLNQLGFNASTNKTIQGVRTKHDLDIYAEIFIAGQKVIWVIEAKYWNKKVSKLHVLALRSIIDDIGADKGFIISKKGFQKGALEANKNTDINLITFDEFISQTIDETYYYQLSFVKERIRYLYIKYFAHSKKTRIKYEIRSDLFDLNKLGGLFPNFILYTLYAGTVYAENKKFPLYIQRRGHLQGKEIIRNIAQLINWLNENLNYIDTLLLKSEIQMLKNNEYNPNYNKEYVTHEFLKECSLLFASPYISFDEPPPQI